MAFTCSSLTLQSCCFFCFFFSLASTLFDLAERYPGLLSAYCSRRRGIRASRVWHVTICRHWGGADKKFTLEYLRNFFCAEAFGLYAPNQSVFLTRHSEASLPFPSPLWKQRPAQSCQSAALCQPNHHTHLKGGKSYLLLPGVAFPI